MSGALRICFLTGEYPPDEGGVADYTRCLAEALVERGVEVDVVSGRFGSADGVGDVGVDVASGRSGSADGVGDVGVDVASGTSGSTDGVNDAAGDRSSRSGSGVRDHRSGRSGPPVRVHRVMPDWGWSSTRALGAVVAGLGADVVHIQYQTAAFGMHPAINFGLKRIGRSTGARTAITYHDLREPYLFPKAGRIRGWVTRRPAATGDLVIATNEADHAALTAWGGARRLALIPIGANVPDRPPAGWAKDGWRDAAGIPRDSDLLIYFGFLNPSKGGRTLLAALGRLVSQGRDARLVMLGGSVGASDATNAAELEAFRSEVAVAGLAERIIWTGHVPPDTVSGWLRAADVAVLPYADGASYRRGSLLAALEHGCAVVTTAVDRGAHPPGDLDVHAPDDRFGQPAQVRVDHGAPPPLRDRETARLVRPGDPEALAAAVAEVLDDPALAAGLSAGAKALSAHFGWEAIAERHEALYCSAVGRG